MAARRAPARSANGERENDQHFGARPLHQEQPPGFPALPDADVAIAADAEATLPALIEEVKRQLTPDRKRVLAGARTKLGREPSRRLACRRCEAGRATGGTRARSAWRASRRSSGRRSRTTTGRSCPGKDSSAAGQAGCGTINKHYRYIGGQGAGAMGYGAPAAVGAALANRKHGRLSINIQTDGDLNYAPGRALDGRASPDSAADGDAQQPRLSPGGDVRPAHGERARIAARTARTSAPRCANRTSTTRRWRRPTACTAKGRSPIRRICAGDQACARSRQARRAGADRRHHAAALRRSAVTMMGG